MPCGDGIERLVPADALEFTLAFIAGAPQRKEQAILAVSALEVLRHLGAERAGGERMVLGALHFHRDAVLDGDLHRAGVGAIVRAGGAHALAFDGSLLDGGLHARTRSTVRIPQFYAVQGRTPGSVPKRMRSIWPMR